MKKVTKHTLMSHDDDEDTTKIVIVREDRQIDIHMIEDEGKVINGAEVEEGYCRTVRIEVKDNVLKVMIYPVQCDEPMIVNVAFDDNAARVVE